jgi:hypothetical protein
LPATASERRLLLALHAFVLCLLLAAPAAAGSDPFSLPLASRVSDSLRAPDVYSDPLTLETVLPSVPGKNQVRWWELDWKWTEVQPLEKGAPFRLFFYASERGIAEMVSPLISQAYRDHAERFAFTPDKRIPFLLYNSHFEFESTTAFFINESVLGVTSTEELTMALPYWGERDRFEHVMRHELAHQFTIQKVLAVSRAKKGGCNPLQLMPLWFIEGIAEAYSLPQLTPEVRAALADRLTGPKKRELPEFFSEGMGTYERVYLLGHAQVRFLMERYGDDFVMQLLDESPQLCNAITTYGSPETATSFSTLLSEMTGESPETIDTRWKAWARAQLAPQAPSPPGAIERLEKLGAGIVDSFSLSPDGRTIFYRTYDPDTGVARLYLRDLDDPDSRKLIAQDQRLGLSSFHPVGRRVTAVGADTIAYIGRSGPTDRIFFVRYRRAQKGSAVRFDLGERKTFALDGPYSLIEAGFPAIDPRSGAIVFSGLSRESGFLDIYRIDDPFGRQSLERLTDDPYAEDGLAFGPDGKLYFASDATQDARFEIAELVGSQRRILTDFPDQAQATAPSPAPDGSIVFAGDASGLPQAWRLSDGETARVSQVVTSLDYPARDANGGLVGLQMVEGRPRLVRLSPAALVSVPGPTMSATPPIPWQLVREPLGTVHDYQPLRTLKLDRIIGLVSTGPLIWGDLVFADMLKGRLIGLSIYVQGDLDLSQGEIFYLDRSDRWTLGGSLFLDSGEQLETPTDGIAETYVLQRFGGRFLAAYPFGIYTRLQGYVAPEALRVTDFTNLSGRLSRTLSDEVFPGVEAGLGLVIDTLRLSILGPVSGWAFTLGGSGTVLGKGADPFARATVELRFAQAPVRSYERLFLQERLAAGQNFGGAFAEQFYLPAAYNLRAFQEGSLALIGNGYYLGQIELSFPIAPVLADLIYLQGLAGGDAGSVYFERRDAFDRRIADFAVGASLGFGPLALRLQWAKPFRIGGLPFATDWVFHLSLLTPYGALY